MFMWKTALFLCVGRWLCMQCCECASCGSENGRGDTAQWRHEVSEYGPQRITFHVHVLYIVFCKVRTSILSNITPSGHHQATLIVL